MDQEITINCYRVEGLELIAHDALEEDGLVKYESVTYQTPSGSRLCIAQDDMGIQIVKSMMFFPPPFTNYRTVQEAVEYLRQHTSEAVAFFDNIARQRRIRDAQMN